MKFETMKEAMIYFSHLLEDYRMQVDMGLAPAIPDTIMVEVILPIGLVKPTEEYTRPEDRHIVFARGMNGQWDIVQIPGFVKEETK